MLKKMKKKIINVLNFYKYKLKWWYFAIPIGAIAVIANIYFISSKIQTSNLIGVKNKIDEKIIEKIENDPDNIFPEINANNYLSYLEFENNKPKITKKIIEAIVNDVIKRLNVNYGNVSFDYKINNLLDAELLLQWNNGKNKTLTKNILIKIQKNDK